MGSTRQLTAVPDRWWTSPVPGPVLQRKCACGQHTSGGECHECKKNHETMQRCPARASAVNGLPPIVHDVLRSPGQPLEATDRTVMERSFGHDFSRVRVHTDVRAAESAQGVHARAYTVGDHVVFGTGHYRTTTLEGQALLAHELTHVVEATPGIHRDKDPTHKDVPRTIPAADIRIDVSKALKFEPHLKAHTPEAPTPEWRTRVLLATGLPAAERQLAFLRLINEAAMPEAARYPELLLPVTRFKSDAAARHGEVALDTKTNLLPGQPGLLADTRPSDDKLTNPPRIYIVLTPAALDPDAGPVSIQHVLNHEYVHFLQKLHRELMVRPTCRGQWKGQAIGGNPNREVLAVATTFSRFFPAWADDAKASTAEYPRNIRGDMALLQAYFPCVNPEIQKNVVRKISAATQGRPRRIYLLRSLLEFVRDRALPDTMPPHSENAMARIADVIGHPLPADPRLPPSPARASMGSLFNLEEFKERSHERTREKLLGSEP